MESARVNDDRIGFLFHHSIAADESEGVGAGDGGADASAVVDASARFWHIRQGVAHVDELAPQAAAYLDQARVRSVQMALQAGCRFVAEPAGLFGWVDTGVDTDTLALRLLDEGYLIAPGGLFHASRQPSTHMRINFATSQDPAFWAAFRRLRG